MPYALCSMPYALCSMPYAPCPLLHALCPLLPADLLIQIQHDPFPQAPVAHEHLGIAVSLHDLLGNDSACQDDVFAAALQPCHLPAPGQGACAQSVDDDIKRRPSQHKAVYPGWIILPEALVHGLREYD